MNTDFSLMVKEKAQAVHMTAMCGNDRLAVLGAIDLDGAAKTQKLVLMVIYPDGTASPCVEYAPSKLVSYKGLMNLLDMQGFTNEEEVKSVYKAFATSRSKGTLAVIDLGAEKMSLPQAHRALSAYVKKYMEPEKVFQKEGYGYIEASYVPDVLKRLELGWERLELYKNFKLWGLLRTNGGGTGHPYTYKVGRNWYMSFPLAEGSCEEGGERA